MSVDTAIIGKIQKLLALATSSNENEAAAAAAKAQEMLFKYELDEATVNKVDATPIIETKFVINDGHRGVQWKSEIASGVAKSAMCELLIGWYTPRPNRTVTTGRFVGKPNDVDLAIFTFNFLVTEINRLCDMYLTTYTGWEHKTTVRASWCLGAAITVARILREEFNQRRGDSQEAFALVEVKDAEIQSFMAEKHPNLKGTYSVQQTDNFATRAYRDGSRTGATIAVAKPVTGGPEAKQIKA